MQSTQNPIPAHLIRAIGPTAGAIQIVPIVARLTGRETGNSIAAGLVRFTVRRAAIPGNVVAIIAHLI